ncbi:MAG: hypothetical protein HY690_06420 [Chloroflexi bacterium]|nr:hypothetical protein [Chloroflexota bacterium]
MQWPDPGVALKGVLWAVVGAVATRQYMAERQTQDLDIAVARSDARTVRSRLRRAGYTYLGELKKDVVGSSWRAPSGQDVDVVEIEAEWWPQAAEEAQQNRDPAGLPILPLPYLVLMKLEASRAIDVADLARMLGQADRPMLERVRAVVGRDRPEDLDDLEHLIYLGKLEVGDAEPPP